ncbi:MAG: hypothetical protein HRU07_07280 [Nitrosopumilus sp.]|nr:hypothetical protein [Nitrosopumilus sp.]NRA05940.1 hypothetical protein [Nitrosopumilus sp.]
MSGKDEMIKNSEFLKESLENLLDATEDKVVRDEVIIPLKKEYELAVKNIKKYYSRDTLRALYKVSEKIMSEYRMAFVKQHGHDMRYP